jgi:hypothetical protein
LTENKQLKVVKARKETVMYRFQTFNSLAEKNISETNLDLLITITGTGASSDFDNRYSLRGVQWAVKLAKAAGIIKEVHTTYFYGTLILELICWKRHGYHDQLKTFWDIKMLRSQWNTICQLESTYLLEINTYAIQLI